jgi:hypothetical protein
MLEQFPYKFVFNSSVPYPICNKDHKSENIKNGIDGRWGADEYYGERTYHLEWCEAYQNDVPIVSVKV